jgi:hypothetical protein
VLHYAAKAALHSAHRVKEATSLLPRPPYKGGHGPSSIANSMQPQCHREGGGMGCGRQGTDRLRAQARVGPPALCPVFFFFSLAIGSGQAAVVEIGSAGSLE